jgi:transposase
VIFACPGVVLSRARNFGAVVANLQGEEMTISKEIEAEVVRLFHAEGWRRNTIAKQLQLHHSSIARILSRHGLLPQPSRSRASIVDKYIPFIKETFEKYPKLNSTRLYHMVKERGYPGAVDHFRHLVAKYKPEPKREAYLRLSTLSGEQAQVDWGHFGKLKIGNAERRLLAFVMVLSYSRYIFLRFYFGDHTANFLRGHVDAFNYYQAVPREILYDNLKSAVLERIGSAIHFNPELLSLATHYRFAPKPVGVRRANEKGRVERAIGYVRTSFFAAREFNSIDDLNSQALAWCRAEAGERKWPQDKTMTVAEAFEKEKPVLLLLPEAPYPVYDRKPVYVGKTPYVRFDLNDYSVPHNLVGRSLVVEATPEQVSIVDGFTEVAKHGRSFDKGQQIEDPKHIEQLTKVKREASKHRGTNRLQHVVPSSLQFFKLTAERGHNMGRLTQMLIRLLDMYGATELEAALNEAIATGSLHSAAIQQILEKRRIAKGAAPPVLLRFANDKRINELNIVPKSLDMYDELFKNKEEQ